MTDKQHKDRLTMPGQEPTDEDLRTDVELTRQELAETVAALADKADVKARVHEKAEIVRARGDELVEKVPESVRPVVRPVVTTATHRPVAVLAVLVALLLVLRRLAKR
jgi:Protein of unknown function (DUF3618)